MSVVNVPLNFVVNTLASAPKPTIIATAPRDSVKQASPTLRVTNHYHITMEDSQWVNLFDNAWGFVRKIRLSRCDHSFLAWGPHNIFSRYIEPFRSEFLSQFGLAHLYIAVVNRPPSQCRYHLRLRIPEYGTMLRELKRTNVNTHGGA